ncbi:uncharacterized protein CLUP02_10554 [Colletotrichum lupini]|uniref:Uncharacterized protein n=1 Tax=Colletotrichum lupini TaxID=145971 RepID=A0A9Q8WIN4_9PEZI|nr:uncharacterized protein CLUP02_10554 [Colletotrichum lupini]UQC85058.1 hypothetical protein CLUP02_10554 [Colletotrichum lupini]
MLQSHSQRKLCHKYSQRIGSQPCRLMTELPNSLRPIPAMTAFSCIQRSWTCSDLGRTRPADPTSRDKITTTTEGSTEDFSQMASCHRPLAASAQHACYHSIPRGPRDLVHVRPTLEIKINPGLMPRHPSLYVSARLTGGMETCNFAKHNATLPQLKIPPTFVFVPVRSWPVCLSRISLRLNFLDLFSPIPRGFPSDFQAFHTASFPVSPSRKRREFAVTVDRDSRSSVSLLHSRDIGIIIRPCRLSAVILPGLPMYVPATTGRIFTAVVRSNSAYISFTDRHHDNDDDDDNAPSPMTHQVRKAGRL